MSGDYPLVVIVGPTAAGKSSLAIALAEQLGGEIVNCDSVQVYRGFDIGTGKVAIAERRGIPHHLLDVAEPGEVFTAGDYRQAATRVLAEIRRRGRLSIVVGGTGLYLRALLEGLFEAPQRSEQLRARLANMAKRWGRESLHRLLRRLDATAAERIHRHDTSKVMRALEVCLLARQPISALQGHGRAGLRGFRVLKIGLNPDRTKLAQRINLRVERMFSSGLVEETRVMLSRPDAEHIKPLGALGYSQAVAMLRAEISREEAIRSTQAATRQYAKRQMTWFRRETGVEWLAGFGDDAEIQRRALDWIARAWHSAGGPARSEVDSEASFQA
ncbi:MAG: tRNA (adenosine(37)-N6)-dimethylallyltransferase MiaA [Acidobacteriia bacterium]|nr:tRNA (adenosine(37)-N6)-dimethylallyltransferase MiaA [Terriglobia bacterium]